MAKFSWAIEIRGDASDLEHLTRQLTGKELNLKKCERGYLLRSSRFDDIENSTWVVKEASQIVAVLNGLLKLLRHSSTPLTIGTVYGTGAAGTVCTVQLDVITTADIGIKIDDGETIIELDAK